MSKKRLEKDLATSEKYIKPQIKVQELTLHSLLGENGWLPGSSNPIAGSCNCTAPCSYGGSSACSSCQAASC